MRVDPLRRRPGLLLFCSLAGLAVAHGCGGSESPEGGSSGAGGEGATTAASGTAASGSGGDTASSSATATATSGATTAASTGAGGGGAGAPLGCEQGHFDSVPMAWSLVTDYAPTYFSELPQGGSCAGGKLGWFMGIGFSSNGIDDIVVSRDLCSASPLPAGQWRVYSSQPTGMGAPSTFTLPALPTTVEAPDWLESCDQGGSLAFSSWQTKDLDGDGLSDLVGLRDPCYGSHGDGTWIFYKRTPTGFADGVLWNIPVSGVESGLPYTYFSGAAYCVAKPAHNFGWATEDLTGDGIPDLVIQRSCTDDTVGVSKWLLYPGTGAGFAQSPTTIDLPVAPAPLLGWFPSNGQDNNGPWVLRDLDGDGHLDLVAQPSDVGQHDWTLFRGKAGGGFDLSPTTFPNPLVIPACGFGDQFIWYLLDMTGDGLEDIVVVRDDCSDLAVGSSYWKVLRNDGQRFTDPIQWGMAPTPGYGFAYKELSRGSACSVSGAIVWRTLDLTGDKVPDLMVSIDQCGADATLGTDHWKVYPGVCP